MIYLQILAEGFLIMALICGGLDMASKEFWRGFYGDSIEGGENELENMD